MGKTKAAAPALEVVYRKVADLIPYARNARTHSDIQISQIASSIKEFGFANPVLVDSDGGILAGHGRTLAAHKLGLDEVPTICLGHLTSTQKRAYVLVDNQLALNAGWDFEMLAVEMEELAASGFDTSLLAMPDADWKSDIASGEVDKIDENLDGIKATVKVTCSQELKAEISDFIRIKLSEGGYNDVSVA
jgi:ParB-like chromosome segregation protein Spo0J